MPAVSGSSNHLKSATCLKSFLLPSINFCIPVSLIYATCYNRVNKHKNNFSCSKRCIQITSLCYNFPKCKFKGLKNQRFFRFSFLFIIWKCLLTKISVCCPGFMFWNTTNRQQSQIILVHQQRNKSFYFYYPGKILIFYPYIIHVDDIMYTVNLIVLLILPRYWYFILI